ncbi:MAG: bifunctional DNA primase/polymerase [Bauldia sp.]
MTAPGLSEAAAFYAAAGYRVFPCVPGGKEPLTPNGFLNASADAAVVARWWRRWPAANIGLALSPSGLVALDIDSYKDGCEWSSFIAGKELPDTWAQVSGRGGTHYIFTAPAGHRFPGKLAQFVEIKAAGYVLLAPSMFDGRRYERLNHFRPAPAPAWLLNAAAGTVTSISNAGMMDAEALEVFLAGLDPRAHAQHDDWFSIMCACHHVTAGKAEEAFVRWSAGNTTFAHLSREVVRRWRSLGRRPGNTVGTLIRALRDDGEDTLADKLIWLSLKYDDEEVFPAEDASNMEFQTDRERVALTDKFVGDNNANN